MSEKSVIVALRVESKARVILRDMLKRKINQTPDRVAECPRVARQLAEHWDADW